MKIDAVLRTAPQGAADLARQYERQGYDAAWSAETQHDPFLPLAAASQSTSTIELGTSIAVAFARNPMNLALVGWDLQAATGGRFTMGLGTQIKAHITRRYSMPWSEPANRMRESIQAVRAIWDTWQNGTPLEFEGAFYTHTLMPPLTMPDPSDLDGLALPKIFVAGVGKLMTQVAAEVGDGFIPHPFHTAGSLDAMTLPLVREARLASGQSLDGFEISTTAFVATGATDEQMERAIDGVKGIIAFYGSTPAYRGVLEHHGWGDLQTELHTMTKQDRWAEMKSLIDDDVLAAFAVVAPPSQVATEVLAKYAHRVDRLSFYTPYPTEAEFWTPVVADIKRAQIPAVTA